MFSSLLYIPNKLKVPSNWDEAEINRRAEAGEAIAERAKAEQYYLSKNFESVSLWLGKSSRHGDPVSSCLLARLLFDEEQFEEAERLFKLHKEQVIQLGDIEYYRKHEWLEGLTRMGATFFSMGLDSLAASQKDEALIHFKKSTELGLATAAFNVGNISFEQGNYQQAEQYLKLAFKHAFNPRINADDAREIRSCTHDMLGVMYITESLSSPNPVYDAAKHFKLALAYQSDNEKAQGNWNKLLESIDEASKNRLVMNLTAIKLQNGCHMLADDIFTHAAMPLAPKEYDFENIHFEAKVCDESASSANIEREEPKATSSDFSNSANSGFLLFRKEANASVSTIYKLSSYTGISEGWKSFNQGGKKVYMLEHDSQQLLSEVKGAIESGDFCEVVLQRLKETKKPVLVLSKIDIDSLLSAENRPVMNC